MKQPTTPELGSEHPPLPDEKVLEITLKEAKSLVREIAVVQEMLREGRQQDLPVNISTILEPFQPLGELEVQLLGIASQIDRAKAALRGQGVKITYEDMRERLEELGYPVIEKQPDSSNPWETGLDHTSFLSSLGEAGADYIVGDVIVGVRIEGEAVKFRIGEEILEFPLTYQDLVRLNDEAVHDVRIHSPESEAGICLITSNGDVIDLRKK